MMPFLSRGVVLAALVSTVSGQRVPDFTAALAQAKSSKSDIVVFVHGSDWNQAGEATAKIWNDARFLSAIGGGALLVDMDRKESPTDADKELAKKNEKGNPSLRSIPGVALYDSEGRIVGSYSGSDEIEAAGGLIPAVKKLIVTRRERDDFWKSAEGASAIMKAGRLGQGLDRMDIGLGPKNLYKPVLDEIKKVDPDDQTGYVGKYTFSGSALVGMVTDKAEKKEYAEAEKELAKWYANKRLSTRQRQELQAARFALYQRWPEKKDEVPKVLQQMREVDPKSELGLAAESYLKLLASEKSGKKK